MDDTVYHCSCGAAGDLGELTEHILSKFEAVEDTQDHTLVDVEQESNTILEARAAWQRRAEIQLKLSELLGAPIGEIRDALFRG